jgi:6-phosphogluconolactonase
MTLKVLADPEAVAKTAARFIPAEVAEAVAERGLFAMPVSGGNTPWQMLCALSAESVEPMNGS